MSKSRCSWLSCWCCIRGNKGSRLSVSTAVLTDDDYLLPGGKWDPSLSKRYSHSQSRSQRHSTADNSVDRDGLYHPPDIVPSPVLPTFEDFKLLKTVGRGAFGKVLLSVHQSTRILYAMKIVPKAKIASQKQVSQILAEVNILKKVRHPFCVSLQYAFQNEDYIFYVFEFAAGGMLFHHLRQAGRFNEPRSRFYFGEIILAIDYLHSFGIVFRDLKPENCMLSENGHIVLTDFGSAKILEVSQKASTIAGTPQYMAPEVLRGEPYSFSADWWSCGILLYEMLTGKLPFFSADRVELYKLILRGDFVVPRGTVSPRAKSLLYRMINRDPDFRIGCGAGDGSKRPVSEIKEHPFFSHAPLDPDEEAQYSAEETERARHREAYSRQHWRGSQRSGSIMETAGSVIKSISDQTKRLSLRNPYLGAPCEWTWEELEAREVHPPFHPRLTRPTDVRHFDPTLTNLPPTITDLITTDRALHLEGFDYVATTPDQREIVNKDRKFPDWKPPDENAADLTASNGSPQNGFDNSNEEPNALTKLVSVEVNDF